MLQAIGRRLTYANVVATIAMFLALGGGAVWAASHDGKKVGTGGLKPNAVTAGKIKANAVTQAKIRKNAVTNEKLRPGAVDFTSLAAGTNVVATAVSSPVSVAGASAVSVTFPTPISFTPVSGSVYLMSVEASSAHLARSGTEPCRVTVVPLVNGSEWGGASPLVLSAFEPTTEAPGGLVPAAGETSPIGLVASGTTQTLGARLIGGPRCAADATATVAIAVTQEK